VGSSLSARMRLWTGSDLFGPFLLKSVVIAVHVTNPSSTNTHLITPLPCFPFAPLPALDPGIRSAFRTADGNPYPEASPPIPPAHRSPPWGPFPHAPHHGRPPPRRGGGRGRGRHHLRRPPPGRPRLAGPPRSPRRRRRGAGPSVRARAPDPPRRPAHVCFPCPPDWWLPHAASHATMALGFIYPPF